MPAHPQAGFSNGISESYPAHFTFVTAQEYNEQCIADLKGIDLSNYVAVIGSGPSSPYIAPVDKLIEKLEAACGVTHVPAENLWIFCQRAYESNQVAYFKVIDESYLETPYWDSLVYRYLVNMPFRSFVTLNYDRQMPTAFAERYPNDCDDRFSVYPPQGNDGYFPATKMIADSPCLIAIHGFADPDVPDWEKRAILRLDDYNAHYTGTNPKLLEWWQALLAITPCIFIGTRLQEPGIEQVFNDASVAMRDAIASKKHLHLLACERAPVPPHYPVPDQSFSLIRQLYYDKLDKRHSGLMKILSAFSAFQSVIPRPRSTSVPAFSATSNHNFPNVP